MKGLLDRRCPGIYEDCLLSKGCKVFFKWFRDIRAGQLDDEVYPILYAMSSTEINDDGSVSDNHSATGCVDAAVICPWTLYLTYGDKRILEEQYASMKAWIEYIRGKAQDGVLWNTGFHYGIG